MRSIIDKIAKDGVLDEIVNNVAKNVKDEDLKDLKQDIYITLLEKDEELLEKIYERGQINYLLTRIVVNNINSKTSRFYYLYKKNNQKNIPLDDLQETAD